MVAGITRDDAATGQYDDILTMKQVRQDIIYNLEGYSVNWVAGYMLEVHQDGTKDKPVISDKASKIYTWLGF